MVTSSVTLDSPSMTLSETQIDKFCQSPFISRHLQTASQMPQLPLLGTLAFPFLASGPASTFDALGAGGVSAIRIKKRLPRLREKFLGAGHRNRPSRRGLSCRFRSHL
jgi:hypothetical protein